MLFYFSISFDSLVINWTSRIIRLIYEVYILILPAFGLISEILSKYCQCIIFGRDSMLIALFIIMLLGLIVWGHHMFVVGFDIITMGYFTTSTTIIAIPT